MRVAPLSLGCGLGRQIIVLTLAPAFHDASSTQQARGQGSALLHDAKTVWCELICFVHQTGSPLRYNRAGATGDGIVKHLGLMLLATYCTGNLVHHQARIGLDEAYVRNEVKNAARSQSARHVIIPLCTQPATQHPSLQSSIAVNIFDLVWNDVCNAGF